MTENEYSNNLQSIVVERTKCPVCGYPDCAHYMGGIARRLDPDRTFVIAGYICPKCAAYMQSLVSDQAGDLQIMQLQDLRKTWLKQIPATSNIVCHLFNPVRTPEGVEYARKNQCTIEEATEKLYELRKKRSVLLESPE